MLHFKRTSDVIQFSVSSYHLWIIVLRVRERNCFPMSPARYSRAQISLAPVPETDAGSLSLPPTLKHPAFSEPLEDAQHVEGCGQGHIIHGWVLPSGTLDPSERSGVPTEVDVSRALCQEDKASWLVWS